MNPATPKVRPAVMGPRPLPLPFCEQMMLQNSQSQMLELVEVYFCQNVVHNCAMGHGDTRVL